MHAYIVRSVATIRLMIAAMVAFALTLYEATTGFSYLISYRRGSGTTDKLFLFIICYIAALFFQEVAAYFIPNFGEPLNTLFGIIVGAVIFFIILRKYSADLDDD